MTARTVATIKQAYTIKLPDVVRTPLVYSSPHSGRNYPDDLTARTPLRLQKLRSLEDCYVEELFDHVTDQGAPLISAEFPRAYIDANREPFELDPKLIKPPLPAYANSKSLRVKGGLGTLPRITADGSAIYRTKLTMDEALQRIARFHQPYHQKLTELTTGARDKFGMAVLIDCHSMPSSSHFSQDTISSDIIIGNRFDRSCGSDITNLVVDGFRSLGFKVALNRPYAGGFITEQHGRPDTGIHAVQIEINRALYLNEYRYEKSDKFEQLALSLTELTKNLSQNLETWYEKPLAAE